MILFKNSMCHTLNIFYLHFKPFHCYHFHSLKNFILCKLPELCKSNVPTAPYSDNC